MNRLISKLHLVINMGLFGIFFVKFVDHMRAYALKISRKICAKIAHFSNQSEFRKRSSVKLLIKILIFVLLGTGCSSQAWSVNKQTARSIEELQTQLENILIHRHVPGMSIAIVRREGSEWIAGLGKADLANNRHTTPTTLFRIGSISKGFVSLAILKLADEGKLSLEDSVKTLLPEVWFDNKWEASNPVRVVHLLENTTGWDDMHLRELAKSSSTISSLEALDYDHSSRISRWPPGTRISYCNSGPAVAAYLVEKIAGKNFEEYIMENLFKPIGMQTATYFEPASKLTTTLYHSNGKTPLPYWNLLYRSVGAINASANDMANYLLFYLNRGHIDGKQVVPSSIVDRMETPSSSWASKEGLRMGYGLNNYSTIYDGFVYQGHDGNVPGGLSAIHYMPNEGIGYFYSLNSGNREAFKEAGATIRAYITHQLQKPPSPLLTSFSEETHSYAGWYEPNSPRMKLFSFLERLFGVAYIHFQDNKLIINSLNEKKAIFLPVTDTQFLYAPINESQDTQATLQLLTPNAEGKFIQLHWGLRNPSINVTLKRIPSWLAISEITITGFVLMALISTLVYAPFWILKGLNKKRRRQAEQSLKLWPLVAALSLLSIIFICMLSNMDFAISRFGNLTAWSFALYLATIIFPLASFASVVALWKAPKGDIRRGVFLYSTMAALALVITTTYLGYWEIIGLRSWT